MFPSSTPYKLLLFLLFLLVFVQGKAQTNQEIWVIGNSMDVSIDASFWQHLDSELEQSQYPVYLLFTGDIAGCKGTQPNTAQLKPIFNIAVKHPEVEIGLLAGDRDWTDSGKEGWECVQKMEDYVEAQALENIDWLVDDGCPGPDEEKIGENVLLLPLNTQWWNHPYRKPIPADAMCDEIVEEAIHEEIEDAIKERRSRNIVIAGHYPPYSTGAYNGYFPIQKHLLPPVFGGMLAAFHENVGTKRDITNERFEEFTSYVRELSGEYENLIFLGGHGHHHQVVSYLTASLLNSGAPVGGTYVKDNYITRFTSVEAGFLKLYFKADGEVGYHFMHHQADGFSSADTGILYQSPCAFNELQDIPVNQISVACDEKEQAAMDFGEPVVQKGNKSLAAGKQYSASNFHQLFFGPHYREDWTSEITVPLLHLDTAFGGLEILGKGGGRQTKSLKMRSPDGRQYVFRSVDKDPTATLRYALRSTVAATVTRDQTSSQHPYGAIPVAQMLSELQLLHATPRLYVMPDDPRLGRFRTSFAGMLGMIEERPTSKGKGEMPFGEADDIYKSYEFFRILYDESNTVLDKQEFARARLFDILIGDWSKHEDNWKWAAFHKNEYTLVRPIPRDRDHAFSNLDGFIPYLATRKWAVPNLEPFKHKINSVRSLTYQARHMDRFLGNELTKADWQLAAKEVQSMLTDEEMKTALQQLPVESYAISGEEIFEKLQQRRLDLNSYADRFYQLLARQVDVLGTNKKDQFLITRNQDGTTLVQVYGKDDSQPFYQRRFLPDETQEIRLYGLRKNDKFVVKGEAKDAIRLRLIGGIGDDEYEDTSVLKKRGKHTYVYERDQGAEINLGANGKQVNSWNDDLYYYDRRAFQYNTYTPLAYIAYNSFNGLRLNGGLSFTRHNFEKRAYSAKHSLNFEVGTLGNFALSYKGDFHHVLRKWDMLIGADWAQPDDYYYFFGIGNGTVLDENLFDEDYYLVQLDRLGVQAGFRRNFWKNSSAKLMMGISQNEVPVKSGRILMDVTDVYGAGELTIANATATVELDLRDHKVFPSRGYRFFVEQEMGMGNGKSYGTFDTYLEYYLSPRLIPVVLGVRSGYSSSFGETPFYKLPQLGQQQNLRGFRRNRFAGDRRVYLNSELRFPIGEIKNAFWPIRVGLRGFYDMGKIFEEGFTEESWQLSYGGGIYILPLVRSYTLSLLIGASEEENAIIGIELGTNF